jgi:hypothetical protein
MCADEFLLPWLRSLLERLPGVRLLDAHTHIGGDDPDGWRCSPAELHRRAGAGRGRAVVFSLMDSAGYREANDAVLAAAGGLKRPARPVLPRRSAHRSGPGA